MRCISLVSLAALAAACSQPAEQKQAAGGASTSASASATSSSASASAAGASAASTANGAAAVEEKNDTYEFSYKWPAAAGANPKLRAWLEANRDKTRAALKREAEEWKEEAAKDNFPFNPYSSDTEWKVVADTPGFLSLSSEFYVFSGGAHGNTGFDALLWDRHTDTQRKPADLFDLARLKTAIQPAFCNAIDKQRAEKRGEKVVRSSAMFDDCIDPIEQTLILGSSNRKAFDRIGVLVGPYAAGPYAEGAYEVTLPVTAAVMAALKPEYRNAFVIGK